MSDQLRSIFACWPHHSFDAKPHDSAQKESTRPPSLKSDPGADNAGMVARRPGDTKSATDTGPPYEDLAIPAALVRH